MHPRAKVTTVSRDRESLLIGRSLQGRPIPVTVLGARDAALRALVVAGQHGDEPAAMTAVQTLIERWRPPPEMAVAFVTCLNPDGRAAGRRANAHGVDLNRDHQRLTSPECRALHEFARSFDPGLIVDVHTFKARRRTLTVHGLEWGADILFETDNHPCVLGDYSQRWRTWLEPVIEALTAEHVRCDQYLLLTPSGRVRSSSADIVDARNGLSARVDATAVLVEGREPSRRYGSTERTEANIARAVMAVLARYGDVPSRRSPRASCLHLDAKRVRSPGPATALLLTPGARVAQRRTLAGRAFLTLCPERPIVAPAAYGVPLDAPSVISLLQAHGFRREDPEVIRARIRAEEVAFVRGAVPSKRVGRAVRDPDLVWHTGSPDTDRRAWFLTEQDPGHRLSAFLEPHSRFGLHRYSDLGLRIVSNEYYAVARGLELA